MKTVLKKGLLIIIVMFSYNQQMQSFAFTKQKKSITRKEIEQLVQDFHLLVDKCPTKEELALAREILQFLKTDSKCKMITDSLQKQFARLNKQALALNSQSKEMQFSINKIMMSAQQHLQCIKNRVYGNHHKEVTVVHVENNNMISDHILAKVNKIDEAMTKYDRIFSALVKKNSASSQIISKQNNYITTMQQELTQLRSAVQQLAQDFNNCQTHFLESLTKNHNQLMQAQHRCHAADITLSQKNHQVSALTNQLSCLQTNIASLGVEVQQQKKQLKENETVLSDLPAIKALMKVDKNKIEIE